MKGLARQSRRACTSTTGAGEVCQGRGAVRGGNVPPRPRRQRWRRQRQRPSCAPPDRAVSRFRDPCHNHMHPKHNARARPLAAGTEIVRFPRPLLALGLPRAQACASSGVWPVRSCERNLPRWRQSTQTHHGLQKLPLAGRPREPRWPLRPVVLPLPCCPEQSHIIIRFTAQIQMVRRIP